MSVRSITDEIDRLITGIEVQEAVDLTVDYIRRTMKFKEGPQAAYGYWAGLTEDQRIEILRKALVKK